MIILRKMTNLYYVAVFFAVLRKYRPNFMFHPATNSKQILYTYAKILYREE